MCGVYGFMGKPDRKTARIIRKLGIANEIRGRDSTGVAIVTKDTYTIYKKPFNAHKFFKKFSSSIRLSLDKPFVNVIGHTRQATRGKVSQENAHPYTEVT